jgi:hypothetical protein
VRVLCVNQVDIYKLKQFNWYTSTKTVNDLYDIQGIGLVPCSKFITEEEYTERKRQEKIELVLS